MNSTSYRRHRCSLFYLLVGMFLAKLSCIGQVYEKVFDFTEARAAYAANKGSNPTDALIQGAGGDLFGTTQSGGANNYGTVYKLTPQGQLTTIVEFTANGVSNKGRAPNALVKGSDGSYYGTTGGGGLTANGYGTVFRLTTAGVLTTLIEFTGNGASNKGASPAAALVQGTDGNFYGTTSQGGAGNFGTVFRMTPAGVLTTLVEFTGNGASNKGSYPRSALVQGSDGSFYGTTQFGGASDYGTVFKITPAGALTTLVEFTGNGLSNKGRAPTAALIQGSDGNFRGVTSFGGANNLGTVFTMTAAGVLTTLVEFTGNGASNKGSRPAAALIQGSDGNFYGTTGDGGANGFGTAFKITSGGLLTTLVSFTGKIGSSKGSYPGSSLVQGVDGNFYGVTQQGGSNDLGTVFTMTTAGLLTTFIEFAGNGGSPIGSSPEAPIFQSSDGDFYGTTPLGGAGNYGTVFKMTLAGALTTLAEFTGVEGPIMPRAALVQGADGNFYGTTAQGGGNDGGTVFKMTPSGVITTLVEFTYNGYPTAALCQGNDGNFYGTTESGGTSGSGTVFKMTPSGELTTLVDFHEFGPSNKGSAPSASLTLGNDGNFYGTTSYGGAAPVAGESNLFGNGTVFRMTPEGVLTTLVEFTGNGSSNKGSVPHSALVLGSDGNFYGTTRQGGAGSGAGLISGNGTVFRMTPEGELTTLVEFTGNGSSNKGSFPNSALVEGRDGNFYGTTSNGGANNLGTVFKMTPEGELATVWEFFPSSGGGYPEANLIVAADGNLYGTTYGPEGTIYRLVMPGAPTVAVSGITTQSSTMALVEAQINARGTVTTVAFEYGTDGVSFHTTLPVAGNLTGYQTKLVGTTLSNLSPASTYYYRFRATSSAGTTVSAVQSFSTLAAPLASAVAASELAPASARLHGTVNARNYDAAVRFEWGTDGNAFPNSVTASPATVTGNTVVPVSAPVAGLTKGTTYYYRVVATNAGGTTVSGTQSFRTLTEPTAVIGGNFALTTTSVRVEGSVNAQSSDSSVVFEYGTDGASFPNSVAATPGTATGETSTPVSAVLTTLSQGATYHYRIKATSAGGVGTSSSASFSMNVLSGFTQVFPGAPPEAQGFLIVNLTPAGILSGWRFVGEQQWRASGVPAGGLTTGDRDIEFRPVPGYIHPPNETASILSGEAATILTRDYFESASSGSGGLSVTLKPDSITSGASRAQWRLLGESDAQWRDSGATLAGLIPGSYLIECKPVTGRATPPNANVIISDGATAAPTITYFLPDSTTGTPPGVLAFESVTGDTIKPYAHVGQIRSNAGSSSGFVVKARVVATAAHVVWDDGTLSTAQGLQWLFQRHRGLHEPKPVLPRGFYLFDGYAAQRVIDNSPGDSSPQSQTLDVAAMYFNEDAGRGGYGGFLASDLAQNEFLLSNANKMLVGYPVDGVATTSQGRMHATAPFNVVFSAAFGRTFTTSGIRSSGGNSGGPLCVQFEGGAYYPAAIYLGGDNQTVVRAIDSAVIDLFNRAETSGNGGGNNTGGGITHTSISTIASGSAGAVKVIIEPAGARNAGAGWRLSPETSYRISGAQRNSLNAGTYVLQLLTVPGYEPPAQQSVTVTAGNLTTLTYTYVLPLTAQELWRQELFGSASNSSNGADGADPDGDGFTNVAEYAAGTHPLRSFDHLKTENPQRSGNVFSVSTSGKAGRTYVLERNTSLSGTWSTVATQGPLTYDTALTLHDAASPPGAAFYRIRVTGPSN